MLGESRNRYDLMGIRISAGVEHLERLRGDEEARKRRRGPRNTVRTEITHNRHA